METANDRFADPSQALVRLLGLPPVVMTLDQSCDGQRLRVREAHCAGVGLSDKIPFFTAISNNSVPGKGVHIMNFAWSVSSSSANSKVFLMDSCVSPGLPIM